jgi:hypothetical protein
MARLQGVMAPMTEALKTAASRGIARPITNADITEYLNRKVTFEAVNIHLGIL